MSHNNKQVETPPQDVQRAKVLVLERAWTVLGGPFSPCFAQMGTEKCSIHLVEVLFLVVYGFFGLDKRSSA